MREIGGHDGGRAAKKTERVGRHALVTLRQEFGDPLGVGLRKDGHGIQIPGAMQLRMGFARGARSQLLALLIPLCATLQGSSHSDNPWKEKRMLSLRKYSMDRRVGNRFGRILRFVESGGPAG
jgi:hypothetical protein